MSHRTIAIACLFVAAATTAARAHTAEEQLAFAEQLLADGEEAYALLEHRRFLFHFGNHHKAGDVAMATARLYIGLLGDTATAQKVLRQTAEKQRGRPFEKQALAFAEFIEVNSDHEGKPLRLYISAQDAEARGDHKTATAKYDQLLREHRGCHLEDDAIIALSRLDIEHNNQAKRATDRLRRLMDRNPRSPHIPEAKLLYVMAVEKVSGPDAEVIDAYRKLAVAYPNTSVAQRALARAKALEDAKFTVKRQHDKKHVRSYKVKGAGYSKKNTEYTLLVEVSSSLSEREVKATLEEAFLAYYQKRHDPKHTVAVEGYFTYPFREAGGITWKPGGQPTFKVKKRDTEDKVKDALFDLLKGGRK